MSKNRIPADDAQDLDAWQIPEVIGVQQKPSLHFQNLSQENRNTSTADQDEMTVGQLTAGELAALSEQIYQEVYQQAFQEGHQSGYETGLVEGREAAFQEHAPALLTQAQGFSSMAAELNQRIEERDAQFSDALSTLVGNLATAVLQRELTVEQTQIHHLVQLCLAKFPHDVDRIDIFVHPKDIAFLQKNAIYEDHCRIHSDETLSVGSCRVTDGLSTAEYIASNEFNELIQHMFQQNYFSAEVITEEREMSVSIPEPITETMVDDAVVEDSMVDDAHHSLSSQADHDNT